jgi:tetratricopeptide (TPR) repeat protein
MQMPSGSARFSSRAATFTPVAVDLLALDHHVALIDADAELHPAQKHFDQAIAEGRRAVALNPNNVGAYGALVDALTVSHRPADVEEAVRLVEKEMRLDPSRGDFYVYFIAAPYVLMGRYQDARL